MNRILTCFALGSLLHPVCAQSYWDQTPMPSADGQSKIVFDSRSGRERFVLLVSSGPSIEVWEYPLKTKKWMLHSPPVKPTGRVEFAAAFDPNRGVTVMFGGGDFSPKHRTNALWEWDGNTWVKRSPTTAPAPRKRCHAVYHAGRKEVVVFAGNDGQKQFNDLWGFDGSKWTLLKGGATKPKPRNDAALAYDSKRDELLMFGGYIGNNAFDGETWRWTKAGWQKLAALSPPSPRGWHDMVYDPVRDRTLLLGQYLLWNNDETWEFDRASLRWSLVSKQPPGGIRRELPTLCYDSVGKRVITFGGNANYGSGFSDQWGPRADMHSWDASKSVWVAEAGTLPDPDTAYEMAYDPARKAIVLAGFWWAGPTWQRIGGRWMAVKHPRPTPFPIARELFDIAYGGSGETVLFGGRKRDGSAYGDTWRFNGARWQKLAPTTNPAARMSHEMVTVLDPTSKRERVLLFGGEDKWNGTQRDDLWLFDGSTWSQVAKSSPWPPRLAMFAMAANAAGTQVLLFGGRTTAGSRSNQTWLFDVATSKWRLLLPKTSPPRMEGVEMTYDAAQKVHVLMATDGKVWTFDGTDWLLRTQCDRPRPVYRAAMAYDPTVQKVRAFGGNFHGPRGEEWLLDISGLARFEIFGAGCSGGQGIPALTPVSRPQLGKAFTLLVTGAGSTSTLAFGLSAKQWGAVKLPVLLERDCWLQVSPDLLIGGGATYQFQIPQTPSLSGSCLYVQALAPQGTTAAFTAPARMLFGN